MNTRILHSRLESTGLGRNRTYMFAVSVIIAGIIGFVVGRMVESVHHGYTKQVYQQQIQGLEQQLVDFKKEIDYYKNKSHIDGSKDPNRTNWIQAISY